MQVRLLPGALRFRLAPSSTGRTPPPQGGDAGSTPVGAIAVAAECGDPRCGRDPAGSHKAGAPGSIPGPGTLDRFEERPGRQIGKAAGSRDRCLWVRIPPRLFAGVRGKTPLPRCVPWSGGTTSGSHPEEGGSTPPGTTEVRRSVAVRRCYGGMPPWWGGGPGSTPGRTFATHDSGRLV
jgi:hypothetical protein